MAGIWLIGWIAPAAMATWALYATIVRHRWSIALWIGMVAGAGYCAIAWAILRHVLRDSNEPFAIAFLQVALSSAGVFVFGAVSMISAKWMTRTASDSRTSK